MTHLSAVRTFDHGRVASQLDHFGGQSDRLASVLLEQFRIYACFPVLSAP